MASVIGNYLGNAWLAYYVSGSGKGLYLALHSQDPTALGSTVDEFAGGGYQRRPVVFGSPNNKTVVNTNAPTFSGVPAGTVRYFGVWTAPSGGNFMFAVQLVPAIVVASDSEFYVTAGDIALTV